MKLLLVGDSTVTDDAGWGNGFRARLAGGARCLNQAMGGRSSKSYRDEGHWDTALATDPDVVLLQFGHNDEPGQGADRETDPDTTFAANLARYVADTRAAAAIPILVTPLARRNFGATGDLSPRSLRPYVIATRRTAIEHDVPLIDLHEASFRFCRALGPAGCERLSARRPDGSVDTTHLNAAGGLRLGSLVADLVRGEVPALRRYLTPVEALPVPRARSAPTSVDGFRYPS